MRLRTLLIAALLVGGFIYITAKPNSIFRRAIAPAIPAWSEPQVAHGAGLTADEQNNIDIYKTSKDRVVYITSTVYQRTFFFGLEQGHALGSGFLISPDGQIMTNNHVISGSSEIEVTLTDQSTYKATALVRDPQDDLALIKINPKKKINSLTLGDSDHAQVGQKVLAIGQPFGLKGTLTVGVISSLGVDIKGENNEPMEGMIQTDAAINSGNSGGPLLDSDGNVIGINTAIFGQNGNIGIGFAMPINRAKLMLEDYHAGKRFGRASFGAGTVYIAGDLAEALKLPTSGGLLIQEINRGGAADQAGLRQYRDVVRVGNVRLGIGGDFITAIDGKPVTDGDDLQHAVARKRPGDSMELTIFRNNRSMNVRVTLLEASDRPM
jgi:S1-C subfamily serine protease